MNARGEPTGVTTITFPVGNTTFKANISKDNLVTRVEYTVDTAMLGDTVIAALYSNYQDHAGVKFPGRIVRIQGASPTVKLDGFPILTLTVGTVTPNAKVSARSAGERAAVGGRTASRRCGISRRLPMACSC